MRWLKRTFFALVAIFVLLILALVGLGAALNTPAGQHFAVTQINKFGKNYVRLGGLSGRFPSELQIPSLELIDTKGVWLNAEQVNLDWSPTALLRRHLAIKSLTANSIHILRSPIYPQAPQKKSGSSGFSIPRFSVTLNKLEIGTLRLDAALAGQDMTFHVAGHASLPNLYNADLAIKATSEPNVGSYQVVGTLSPLKVSLTLAIHEQPGGLIEHLIDAPNQWPLDITATVIGPRSSAKLDGALAFGPAILTTTGLLNLNPAAPSVDMQIRIPALAPLATQFGLPIDGNTTLNLTASKLPRKNITTFSAQGELTLTKTPEKLSKLLIGRTTLVVSGTQKYNRLHLTKLTLVAPGFSLSSSGLVSKKHVNLTTNATLDRVSDLVPRLNGYLYLQTQLLGSLKDLRADARLNGNITTPDTPTGPFLIILKAQSLPNAPFGTLTGTGSLAGAPLSLAARFSYSQNTAAHLELDTATWKSLSVQADVKLKAGSKLPTGAGTVSIAHLSDLNALLGYQLGGAVDGQFAYQKNETLNLRLITKNASFDKKLSGLNANIQANGMIDALKVQLDAKLARLMGQPASAQMAGTINLAAQSMNLSGLTAAWHGQTAKLLAPAEINTKPGISVRHLSLRLARADIGVDGTFTPDLNAKASVKNFDLALLQDISPSLNMAGIVNLNATLNGSSKAPQGKLIFTASNLRYITPTTASLPAAKLSGSAVLKGQSADVDLSLSAGAQASATLRGNAPFALNKPMNLKLESRVNSHLLDPFLASSNIKTTGLLSLNAHLKGTPQAPAGSITFEARNIRSESGLAAAMPPANFNAQADIKNQSARLTMALSAGPDVNWTAHGTVPLVMTRAINLETAGQINLKLLDPILAANGNLMQGIVATRLQLSGPVRSPRINGTMTLENGSFLNVSSGLNLTAIHATITAADKLITLQNLSATAGRGKISGSGTVDLAGAQMPVNLSFNANQATPIASDLLTETLNAALTLRGGLKTGSVLGGNIDILKANINIPHSLPPSVANLPIHYEDEAPQAPPAGASSSIPPLTLALEIRAHNQIFIRGDGLFAELGGHITIGGTSAHPLPAGGFSLIRGTFSLAGKTLQFSKGKIDFNGDGFIPALDLEATAPTSNGGSATLAVSGTATKPKIGLSSSPPLPSDEILAQLLFAQSSENLSPFQAASLAAALAQISGVGGGFSPLDSTRNALGLDQLSIGGDGKGGPSVQAGRYIAPGIYVGASQSTTGQGSKANVEINLYKGLKLQSSTGTDNTGQSSSSIGLGYQFNY